MSVESDSIEKLINELVNSLLLRDWEDSVQHEATEYRRLRERKLEYRGEAAVGVLAALLKHRDWAVRNTAALLLGRIQSLQAVAPLLDTLQSDPYIGVQRTAALALHRISAGEALPAVQEWYRSHPVLNGEASLPYIFEYVTYPHRTLHLDLFADDHFELEAFRPSSWNDTISGKWFKQDLTLRLESVDGVSLTYQLERSERRAGEEIIPMQICAWVASSQPTPADGIDFIERYALNALLDAQGADHG